MSFIFKQNLFHSKWILLWNIYQCIVYYAQKGSGNRQFKWRMLTFWWGKFQLSKMLFSIGILLIFFYLNYTQRMSTIYSKYNSRRNIAADISTLDQYVVMSGFHWKFERSYWTFAVFLKFMKFKYLSAHKLTFPLSTLISFNHFCHFIFNIN